MHSQGLIPAQAERLEALRRRHASLEQMISEEQRRPARSDLRVRILKSQKLKLKDEIEEIKKVS